MTTDTNSVRAYAAATGSAYAFVIADGVTGKVLDAIGPDPLPPEYVAASSGAQGRFAVLAALRHLQASGALGHATIFTDVETMPTTWENNKDAWKEARLGGLDCIRLLSTRKQATNPELWVAMLDAEALAPFTFQLVYVAAKKTIFKAGVKVKIANNEPDALKFRLAKALAQSHGDTSGEAA